MEIVGNQYLAQEFIDITVVLRYSFHKCIEFLDKQTDLTYAPVLVKALKV